MLKQRGDCLAMSLNSSGISLKGMPDVMIMKEGKVLFCEIKEPGDRLSLIQMERIGQLHRLGFDTKVIRTKEDIEEVIKIIGG